jgi:hypothetical protein
LVLVTGVGLIAETVLAVAIGRPLASMGPWVFSLVCLTAYVMRGVLISPLGARGLLVLAWAPVYVMWKMFFVRHKKGDTTWVRTQREAEGIVTDGTGDAALHAPVRAGASRENGECVAVCPTGIDIRNGTQMECVNCTACIDACDSVMDKVGRPRGLIRFASLNQIERGGRQAFTARMKLYSGVLAALVALFLFLVFTRAEIETTLLRAPGTLFQQTPGGRIQNLYTLKIINKTSRDLIVELKLENLPGSVRLMGARDFIVPAADLAQTSVLIELDPAALTGGSTKLNLGVYSNDRLLETVTTSFAGPRP